MENCDWISQGVMNLLYCLEPNRAQRGTRCFPSNANLDEMPIYRYNIGEWFRHLIDECLDGDIDSIAIEENIGVVGEISWNNETITNASIHSIAIPGVGLALDDLYLEPDIDADYLRLDIHPKCLGKPFTHPYPHLHTQSKSARFDAGLGRDGNIVVDLLELLYRYYQHDAWWNWAECVCAKWAIQNGVDELPLAEIHQAFVDGRIDLLEGVLRPYVILLKDVLTYEKDRYYPLRISDATKQVLRYPE